MSRGPGSVAYDACEMYNIGTVEQALVNTVLYKRCPKMRSSLQSGIHWARLDGTFCKQYEAAAIKTKPGFNVNPFRTPNP